MAATPRQTAHHLDHGRLSHWDAFFDWVRTQEKRHPDSDSQKNQDLPVRFKTTQNLGFPSQPIERVDYSTTKPTAYVNMMGLTGPMGVLPQHMTHQVMVNLRAGDTALADFLDLINHRLLTLLYRAWKHYRLAAQVSQNELPNDAVTRFVQSVIGQPFEDASPAPRYYAGHFSRRVRSSKGLETLLIDLLAMPVQVESFVGQWVDLPLQATTRLGQTPMTLGQGILLGKRVWDASNLIRIHIGPVPYETYASLLPDGKLYATVVGVVRAYVPPHIRVELTGHTQSPQAAYPTLGRGAQLQRNTWLQPHQPKTLSGQFTFTRANPTQSSRSTHGT